MSLFWRIFLTFWLTLMSLSLLAAVSLDSIARRGAPPAAERQLLVERVLTGSAERIRRFGYGNVQRWLVRRPGAGRGFTVVGEGGEVLYGRRLTRAARQLAASARDADTIVTHAGVGSALALATEGRRLVLMVPERPPGRLLRLGWQGTIARMLLAGLVSALVAWLLSRHIAAPVRHLQAVTRRLAQGELAARVDTADRERRDELGDLARAVDHMAARLQDASENQRRLLADTSHELRSPIARLQVAIELARQRARADIEDELDRIEKEANRLDQLIERVLQVARHRAVPQQRLPVDVAQLLAGIVEDAGVPSRGSIVFERVGDGPFLTQGDPARLRSVFENLLQNALAHAGPNPQVELTVARRKANIVAVCRDDGPGVSQEDISRIFEPFRSGFTADSSDAGHGLGLAIAAAAVSAHEGTIHAENLAPGFQITVRLLVAESSTA